MTHLFTTLLLLATSGSRAPAPRTPAIFFAEAPALLIRVDGPPMYRKISGTDLERVMNTSALIVRNTVGIHYLKVLDGWMESYGLTGNWSPSGVSPFGEHTRIEVAALTSTAQPFEGSGLDEAPPTVFVATTPATLVVTDGPRRWEKAGGSSLERLVNTDAKVFREPTDQELYVQVDSTWYRAWTIHGPWQFIARSELPADIVKQRSR
jgi:hypothetical protein